MSKTNKSNLSGIIFLVTVLAITLFLVVFVFINVGKPFVIKDFSDMKQATVEDYKTIDSYDVYSPAINIVGSTVGPYTWDLNEILPDDILPSNISAITVD